MKKKINAAIRIIKDWKPRTNQDLKKTGLAFTYIGEGAFRRAFQIDGLPLVIKFPRLDGDDNDARTCIRHSVIEMRKIEALRKFRLMRPHIPKVYYFDKTSGVIVMEYIDDTQQSTDFANTNDARAFGINLLVQRLIRAYTGIIIDDFSIENVRYDRKTYKLKLIDVAY